MENDKEQLCEASLQAAGEGLDSTAGSRQLPSVGSWGPYRPFRVETFFFREASIS